MRTILGLASMAFVALTLWVAAPAARAAEQAAAPEQYAAAVDYFQQARSSYHPVCCARRGRDWWAPSRQRCYAAGGHTVTHTRCENWRDDRAERICCKKGRADWWSSRRACRDRGGYVVSGRYCRND